MYSIGQRPDFVPAETARTQDRIDDRAVQRRTEITTPADGMQPVTASSRPLHYAGSPLAAATRGGITAAENMAVQRLSAGRVDLHAAGAQVQQVSPADPRLRAVGARSLARGSRALVSDPADRGHEIWHLAQQAMGQVHPTGRIAGQLVNTSSQLEAEADRMGAAITRQAASAPVAYTAPVAASAGFMANDTAPIQRQVTKFSATSSSRLPPIADLLKEIDYDKFDEDKDDVVDKINDTTKNPKKTLTPTPTQIKASVSPNGPKQDSLDRNSYKSGVVGKIGTDNFFLYSGTKEVFEGGHLIPHELWSDTDPQAASADDYINLVPMSRTMNVGDNDHTWRSQEKAMIDSYEAGNSFKVTIDVDMPVSHEFTYGHLGHIFGLDVESGEEDETVNIYNWLPRRVDIEEDKNLISFDQAYENQIFNVHGQITDGTGLIAVLKQTAIWERCDPSLQDELEAL